MTQQNAIRFLRDIEQLEELRQEIYVCEGYEALFGLLSKSGYAFTGAEFEEVVDHLHVSCATYEEADILMGKANWFRMIVANA